MQSKFRIEKKNHNTIKILKVFDERRVCKAWGARQATHQRSLIPQFACVLKRVR